MAPLSEAYLGNCMELMAKYPDGFFDLAIVDPPYGIKRDGAKKTTSSHGGRKAYPFKGWDEKPPGADYFRELFRVSKHQIIWGANYMSRHLPPSMGWIFWDKGQKLSSSDGELAFTSFDRALRIIEMNRGELGREGTIHPTQKPIKLYTWLLQNYARPGFKILDTHLGSQSSRIAAYKLGFDFYGAELDPDYYRDGCKRFEEAIRMPLFDRDHERKDIVQANFFDALDGA